MARKNALMYLRRKLGAVCPDQTLASFIFQSFLHHEFSVSDKKEKKKSDILQTSNIVTMCLCLKRFSESVQIQVKPDQLINWERSHHTSLIGQITSYITDWTGQQITSYITDCTGQQITSYITDWTGQQCQINHLQITSYIVDTCLLECW